MGKLIIAVPALGLDLKERRANQLCEVKARRLRGDRRGVRQLLGRSGPTIHEALEHTTASRIPHQSSHRRSKGCDIHSSMEVVATLFAKPRFNWSPQSMTLLSPPPNALAAVTHPNPYLYYADLVAHRPVFYDDSLGLWVAASAAAVTEILIDKNCRVRPPSEPVPKALLGSPAGEIFRHLVRMNDGAGHCPFKQAVSAALESIDRGRADELSDKWARNLAETDGDESRHLIHSNLGFLLPLHVVGSLLGIQDEDLPRTSAWMRQLIPALAPAATPEQIEQGRVAADELIAFFRGEMASGQASKKSGLLARLAAEAKRFGRDDATLIISNGIGFMIQAHDATAGLLGSSILALRSHPAIGEAVAKNPALLREVMHEVLRFDAPVQNTRRFVATDSVVAGENMVSGDAILVLLAAANRDPAANADPERFDPFRKNRRVFSFGIGAHACPGEWLALTMAAAGVRLFLSRGAEMSLEPVRYHASVNARIPLLPRNAERGRGNLSGARGQTA